MLLNIAARLDYALAGPTDLLLQCEAAATPQQTIRRAHIDLSPTEHFARISGEDRIGDRVVLRVADRLLVDYIAEIEVHRDPVDLPELEQAPIHQLPGDAVRYLMASRYCPSDEFQTFVGAEFGSLYGGARAAAIRDWIEDRFAYVPGASGPQTTALDTFVQRQGVCRDFAHVLVTMARASAIPARVASVYAPDVMPQDFHLVAELYLGGEWRLVDPTGMARAEEMAVIGTGRDAADVSFLTSYGAATLQSQSVEVRRA